MIQESIVVLLWGVFTALCTGLGVLPFVCWRNPSSNWTGATNALAAGLMVAASLNLCAEGVVYSGSNVVYGFCGGVVFLVVANYFLPETHVQIGELHGADAKKALLIMAVMTLHSFAEGVGVGVSFGGGRELGQLISTTIAAHNIPEGLAIALVLIPRGASLRRACLWSIFSSLPQAIAAVPAFLFVQTFVQMLPAGLGFAAGAMLWMVCSELLPDAAEHLTSGVAVALVAIFAAPLGYESGRELITMTDLRPWFNSTSVFVI